MNADQLTPVATLLDRIRGDRGDGEFLFATIAAGLATFLPVWLSLLIVTLLLLAAAALLGYLGTRSVSRGTPPLPQQAIDEAKLTTQALKSNGNR